MGHQPAVREALAATAESLRRSGVPSPLEDARLLVAFALGIPLNRIDLELGTALAAEQLAHLQDMVGERTTRRPLAYITGETEFMGLRFTCTEAALIPRPETELLVEQALQRIRRLGGSPTVLDLGTGTGAIGLSIAARCPRARVILTDISSAALALAERNAEELSVRDRVRLLEGADLHPVHDAGLGEEIDCLLSNPPYIAPADAPHLPPEVGRHEPREAWLGEGEDGTGFYARVLPWCPEVLPQLRLVGLEVGVRQAGRVAAIAAETWPPWTISVVEDLNAIERLVIAETTDPPADRGLSGSF